MTDSSLYSALMQTRQEFDKRSFVTNGIMSINGFNVTIEGEYKETEPIKFEVTSAGVIVIIKYKGQNYFLMVQQEDKEGHPWEYPSGKVKGRKDAAPINTAIRELAEETGLIAQEDELLGLTYKLKGDGKGALQYLYELNGLPEQFEIASIDKVGRIYIRRPASVDEREIRALVLERLGLINTKYSLGNTSKHKWAEIVYGTLVEKGYTELVSES